jgi:hypothetical protein
VNTTRCRKPRRRLIDDSRSRKGVIEVMAEHQDEIERLLKRDAVVFLSQGGKMSKLAKALEPAQTGNKIADQNIRHMQVISSIAESSSNFTSTEVQLKAEFRTKVFINENLSNESALEAIKDAKKAIIEDVFGEFRPFLLEAKVAIHQRDLHKALFILNELQQQMFDV